MTCSGHHKGTEGKIRGPKPRLSSGSQTKTARASKGRFLPASPTNYCRWPASQVTLVDGREVSSHSEEWRHECEARAILNMHGQLPRRRHLEHIEIRRGKAERKRLEATILALYHSLKTAA